ncbi:hypothetical protein CPLU01_09718 [Colletotrichum plurivorum]|uniref:Uncharacterized protein n=1 Tax=Colletotrichum plurivorum TaxID=2175906 RepID=A0A8H6NBE1_9PEZI|nr:hypothetical protein CPLU01_09718 [Colletotrichum plurivorum]
MGRSKFTFPVPGRKQKPPFGPIVSGPMSKAQKILGTAEINIDAPRQWDTASNSGISVSISESTATYAPTERTYTPAERNRNQRNEEESIAGSNRRNMNTQWEQESEIVPAYLANRFSQLNTDAGPRDFTETSSLTRRGSNSTITSWYDKSKMPLSISQQTSSSAMAKGLPQKANELLDIEGQSPNVAPPLPTKSKKRPGRLDLAPLLSRHRNSLMGRGDANRSSTVLSPDYSSRSPSLNSITSPQPPPIGQRTEKKLTRRSTYERMVDSMSSGRPRTGSSSRRGASDISTLPNLYEHYEQMSFDQVLGHDGPLAKSGTSMANAGQTPLRSPPLPDLRKNQPRPGVRPHEPPMSVSQASQRNAPDAPSSHASNHQPTLTDRDCASSVSSRYTKTSKASKRTSQSLNGSDLMEKSVLSLSSDSEDDFFPDSVSKSTGESQSSDAGSLAPSSLKSIGSRDAPSFGRTSRKSAKHASFAPTNTYLTIPSKSPPSKPPPSVSQRKSSLPPTRYQPPAPSNRSSMYSTKSSSTTNSGSDWQSRSGYGIQDPRPAAPLSTQQSRQTTERKPQAPQRMLSTKSSSVHSIDQPTPPLSPTSVESSATSAESVNVQNGSDSRFMAVTRQEEMLLAALRMKRARMRESILQEYEDEAQHDTPYHHQRNSSQGTIREMEWPEPPQTLRHQTSATSSSTIKAETRTPESRPGSLLGSQTRTRSNSRHLDIPPSSRSNSGQSSRATSRTSSLRRSRPAQEVPQTESRHERILLYLDRPVGNVSSMDFAEPSPDLSDFMDFDNGSDEEDELSSDPSLYRTRAQGSSVYFKGRGRMLRTSDRARHDSSPLRPRTKAELAEHVRVVEAESDIDPMAGIPRPDSPVSPEGTLSLPNHGLAKKKAVRLSAVGNAAVEAGWWDDDG